jgi:hypothetical protein
VCVAILGLVFFVNALGAGIAHLYSAWIRSWTIVVRFPERQEIFLFSIECRLALGPTQPPIQWVPGSVSPGVKRHHVKLMTYVHLVPKLRMMELKLPSPMLLWFLVLNYIINEGTTSLSVNDL